MLSMGIRLLSQNIAQRENTWIMGAIVVGNVLVDRPSRVDSF